MRRGLRLICAVMVCLLLVGCGEEPEKSRTIFAMDTIIELHLWGGNAEPCSDALVSLFQSLEQTWSPTVETSLLARMNRGEEVTLTPEEEALLAQVEALEAETGGAFHPRLLALSQAWGFYSRDYRVPTQQEIADALASRRWDLGAALKGYAGTQAAALLEEMGVDRGILNLGGNVLTFGTKPDGTDWQIAIQDPDGDGYAAVLSVSGTMSVVTSGDYQRYFEMDGVRYHHILDPETGYPADSGLRSVTVICADGLRADALATALFVMGPEAGSAFWREHPDFEAVFLCSDGRILATPGAKLSGCVYEEIGYAQ